MPNSSRCSIALCGENGVGKTNLIEALSLLAPGRGLRRAPLAEMARIGGSGTFAIVAELDGPLGPAVLGTGIEREPGSANPIRKARLNGAPAASSGAFSEHLRLVWMTPALDGLFNGPPGDRRRFVDRLVLAIDPGHASRAAALEQALRSATACSRKRAPTLFGSTRSNDRSPNSASRSPRRDVKPSSASRP